LDANTEGLESIGFDIPLYASLPNKQGLLNQEPNFSPRLHHLKFIGSSSKKTLRCKTVLHEVQYFTHMKNDNTFEMPILFQ